MTESIWRDPSFDIGSSYPTRTYLAHYLSREESPDGEAGRAWVIERAGRSRWQVSGKLAFGVARGLQFDTSAEAMAFARGFALAKSYAEDQAKSEAIVNELVEQYNRLTKFVADAKRAGADVHVGITVTP